MKSFTSLLRPAIASTGVLLVILCGVYPVAVWGIGQMAFREQANGSLITDQDGTIRGSRLLGQNFSGDRYFHPRPSAAGSNGYDAASSGGTNLGPTSQKLADQIKERIAQYRKTNRLDETTPVPADAVTASSSGLDPHISPQNAKLQSARVAKVRNLTPSEMEELIIKHTARPTFGILGAAGVNVMELNRALDAINR